jgi:phosphate transport system protein
MPNLSHRGHISSEFNSELESIRQRVLSMGGLVEQQIRDATLAFAERDRDLAEMVSRTDHTVNELEVLVDEDSCMVLARRQPAAFDLRLVYAIIKTSTQLERMGDEAAKIARLTVDLSDRRRDGVPLVHIGGLAKRVSELVRGALDAFARLDVESALAVVREDAGIDREYEGLLRQCITHMMEDPRQIGEVMDIVWSLRSLERIGDHACNIAEYVIFLVKGKDVRHVSLEEMEREVGFESP